MTTANIKCFGCGGSGHIERECPSSVVPASGDNDKPMWCGGCDRRTRLMEVDGRAFRCQECHPLSHQNLPQLIRCPGCHVLVYTWDFGLCGAHASPVVPFQRPAAEDIAAIVAGEIKRHHDDASAS
jgi:hypothetical protein